MGAEAKNLEAISKAIDHHNATCEWPAVAVAMNPFEVERLGWDSIRGLALVAGADDPEGPGAHGGVAADRQSPDRVPAEPVNLEGIHHDGDRRELAAAVVMVDRLGDRLEVLGFGAHSAR